MSEPAANVPAIANPYPELPPTYAETSQEICARADTSVWTKPRGATVLTILTPEGYTKAADIVKAIDAHEKTVEADQRPLIDHAHKMHKMLLDRMKRSFALRPDLAKLLGVADALALRKTLATAMGAYNLKKQREAEAERVKEQQRLQAIEDKRRQQEAKQLERHGQAEAAAAVLAAPAVAPTVEVKPATPAVEGVSFTEHWSAELVDKDALIDAISDGRVPPEAVQVNMPFLNAQAKQFKQTLNYPGVRAVMEKRPRFS